MKLDLNVYITCQPGVTRGGPRIQGLLLLSSVFINIKSSFGLKGTKIGISHDYPKEIEAIHMKLYPVLKKAKQEKQSAFFKVDKLIINGVPPASGTVVHFWLSVTMQRLTGLARCHWPRAREKLSFERSLSEFL